MAKNKKDSRSRKLLFGSIRSRIMLPLLISVLIQALVFCASVMFGGTVEQTRTNAYQLLWERVLNRRNYLQDEMVSRWADLENTAYQITDIIESVMSKTESLAAIEEAQKDVLLDATPIIINTIRQNNVTGAFLMLDSDSLEKNTVYLRDMDPSNTPTNLSDLMLMRGPGELVKEMKIALSNSWNSYMDFNDEKDPSDFFNLPIQTSKESKYKTADPKNLGYWASPFRLGGDTTDIITYSIPLKLNNNVYGVLGIEITVDYLRSRMPFAELSQDMHGAYMLAIQQEENIIIPCAISGQFRTAQPPILEQIPLQITLNPEYQNMYDLMSDQNDLVLCRQELNLYPNNSPYETTKWVFIGVMSKNNLLDFSINITKSLLFALQLSILLAIISASLVTMFLTHPIKVLLLQLRASDPSQPLTLKSTKIGEIDELSDAIAMLNSRVVESASKLSHIIWAAGVSIGAFEHEDNNKIFFTDQFFSLFGIDDDNGGSSYMERETFYQLLNSLSQYIEYRDHVSQTTIYCLNNNTNPKWIRLKLVEQNNHLIGVAVDITKETQERKRVEFERDHDALTRLYNRRAFQRIAEKCFRDKEHLKIGAYIMMDLDNLKYINDTYGHDSGDEYIKCAAAAVGRISGGNAVVGRMSGDEFCMFIYGYESKGDLRITINKLPAKLKESSILTSDGKHFPVRASGGIAWYPDDADNLDDLKRYADFAMYFIKNTIKGEFSEFDRDRYDKDSYLLNSREELNRIIDENLVDYHFQPIVDAKTAQVYGYEALMRSRSQILRSPREILTLARAQSKLHQVEFLTWSNALETYSKIKQLFPKGSKLFLNSIPNQILSPDEVQLLEKKFPDELQDIILEITEEEKMNSDYNNQKRQWVTSWNAIVALDDFGTGYSGETALLELHPDVVKIDMSIVRDIDSDQDRQKIFQNLAGFCRERGVKVLAEGVETIEELKVVIQLGADYLQGYLIGRPMASPSAISSEVTEIILNDNCSL